MSSHLKFQRLCLAAGCDRPAICKHLCGLHYQRFRKGERLAMRTTDPIGANPPWEYTNAAGEAELMKQFAK